MRRNRRSTELLCCKGPLYPSVFNRRSFIQVGMLGALGIGLGDIFELRAQTSIVRPVNAAPHAKEGQAKNAIQIILPGGLAHQESWDPKPDAPIEYRGPFDVAKTTIPGVVFSENLTR